MSLTSQIFTILPSGEMRKVSRLAKLHAVVVHERNAVGVDDLVVGIGEQLEGERILGAEGLVALDGVERDAEDDGVQSVVLGQVALEVVSLNGAAGGHVLGIEVEDDPLALVLESEMGCVLLRGQAEVGGGGADGWRSRRPGRGLHAGERSVQSAKVRERVSGQDDCFEVPG